MIFAGMLNLRTAVIELDGGPIWMLHGPFGSKADMGAAKRHVCFTPKSDPESEIPEKAMSALPPIADMCSAIRHVCFGPIADSCTAAKRDRYSITSSACRFSVSGILSPRVLADLRLTNSSTLVPCWTGRL